MSSPSKNSNSEYRSVIYVLDGHMLELSERGFIRAQRFALLHQLPLSVVGIIGREPPPEHWIRLKRTEKELSVVGVPLMLLVGERGSALEALAFHLAPRKFDQDSTLTSERLTRHPYTWPGHIEPVENIQFLVRSNPDLCRL